MQLTAKNFSKGAHLLDDFVVTKLGDCLSIKRFLNDHNNISNFIKLEHLPVILMICSKATRSHNKNGSFV